MEGGLSGGNIRLVAEGVRGSPGFDQNVIPFVVFKWNFRYCEPTIIEDWVL